VLKLHDLCIEWRKERVGRNFGSPPQYEYRLNAAVFYLKFVKRDGVMRQGGVIMRSTTLTSSCKASGRVVQDKQTVRKLPEFRVKWCEERAVGNSGRLGLVSCRM
jgi:hypothetical protein